jgi:hypothetical protein
MFALILCHVPMMPRLSREKSDWQFGQLTFIVTNYRKTHKRWATYVFRALIGIYIKIRPRSKRSGPEVCKATLIALGG